MATRIDIIKSVARNLGDLILDGVGSYGSNSVNHADLIHPTSEQLRGRYCYVYVGGGAGQSRIVASYSPSNHKMVFSQDFTTMPSTNASFILTDRFSKADYDNALDRAVGLVRQRHLEERVAYQTLVGTQYEYPVPSGMAFVANVQLVPTISTNYQDGDHIEAQFEFPPRYWSIQRNPSGTYVLAFDPRMVRLEDFDLHITKIMGQAAPDITATDNATVPQKVEEYLVAQTAMQLAAQQLASGEPWRTLFALYRDEIRPKSGDGLEAYLFSYGRGKKVG